MSNSISPSITTASDFKAFISQLQKVLKEKDFDFRGIKPVKALHSAAEAKGFSGWHAMSEAFKALESLNSNSDSQAGRSAPSPRFYEHSVEVFLMTEVELGNDGEKPVVNVSTFGSDKERLESFLHRLEEKMEDRDVEDFWNCRSIDRPEDGEVDEEDKEAVFKWIAENHGVYDLIYLFTVLDYELTMIEFESKFVNTTSPVPAIAADADQEEEDNKTEPLYTRFRDSFYDDEGNWTDYQRSKVFIEDEEISEKVFDEEMVDYKLVERSDLISDLYTWIGEASDRDRTIMIQNLEMLNQWDDEYIWSSILTNEYISPARDTDRFNEICRDVLAAEKALNKEE